MMATWPFWLLFLTAGVLALVVVKRLDDGERRTRHQRRDTGSQPPRPSTNEEQT